MIAGQDDSGWNYDGPRVTERLRTQDMVRGFVTSSEFEKKDNPDIFNFDQRFWNSWKGQIVRAIVLDGVYAKNEIIKSTKLKQKNFELALEELFQTQLIYENQKGFFVNKEVYKKCFIFFGSLQDTLVDWVHDWKHQKTVDISNSKLSHFFLADKLLSIFSEKLIQQAKHEILVLNPYVHRCHISDALMSMSENGIKVKLVAQYIRPDQFKSKFLSKGVFFTHDEVLHAKIILVDRIVGIVSSMNYYPKSTAGGSWEAGLVSVEPNVVHEIFRYISDKL